MRVIAGPEKKTRVMSEKERLVTAFHEMGHAIVGHLLPELRPRPQGFDHRPRPGARLHDLAARRGQVPHHPRRAHRHDGDDAGRPRRRGDRLRRDHDRRLERPREGHRDGQADGDALRHVRAPRPPRVRPRPLDAVPRPRVLRPSPTTRTRSRARSTTRSAASSRRPTRPPRTSSSSAAPTSTGSPTSCSSARRSTRQFVKLLDGAPEDEVFGAEDAEPERSPSRARAGAREAGRPRGTAPDAASAPRLRRRLGRDARRRSGRRASNSLCARRHRHRAIDWRRRIQSHSGRKGHHMINGAGGTRRFHFGLVAAIAAVAVSRGRGVAVANNLDRRTATNAAKYVAKKECQQTSGCRDFFVRGLHRVSEHKAVGKIVVVGARQGRLLLRAPGRDPARSVRRRDHLRDLASPLRHVHRLALQRSGFEGRASARPSSFRSSRRATGRRMTARDAPQLMGIVNVTPDSFSDGGRFLRPGARDRARPRARGRGADLLDIGGESTRPGAARCHRRGRARAGRRRWSTALAARRAASAVSIDTSKAAVAEAALDAGRRDRQRRHRAAAEPDARAVCARSASCTVVLMHMQGDAADDAGRPALRRRRRRRPGVPRRADRVRGRRRDRRERGSGSIPGSASARRSSTTSSSCAGSASCASSAARS